MDDDHREIRLLRAEELRPAVDLFRAVVFHAPIDDAGWERHGPEFGLGRTYGSFSYGELVGTATSFATRTVVPGGTALDTSAVTHVGVRPDSTRRGHLSELMRRQLLDAADRGDVLATLNASETAIYGRFGYGVATRFRQIRVGPHAALRPGAPPGGTVRMLTTDRIRAELPGVYAQVMTTRPGRMERPDRWWTRVLDSRLADREFLAAAVHDGPDGPDGYALWTLDTAEPGLPLVSVRDMRAAGPAAIAGLWRFLLGLDLVDTVVAWRPLDEDLDLLLADPRTMQAEGGRRDELWLRLVDARAALAARTWGDAAPVVLRVHDPLLPANDTAFRIGPDGAKPVEQPGAAADLECDVDALAMAYLGDRTPSELVATGWWRAHDPDATWRADALFGTAVVPWCGTGF